MHQTSELSFFESFCGKEELNNVERHTVDENHETTSNLTRTNIVLKRNQDDQECCWINMLALV